MLKIIIQTDLDFTPPGKRNARVVTTYRGGNQLRWYVGGKLFRFLAPSAENIAMTKEWMGA